MGQDSEQNVELSLDPFSQTEIDLFQSSEVFDSTIPDASRVRKMGWLFKKASGHNGTWRNRQVNATVCQGCGVFGPVLI